MPFATSPHLQVFPALQRTEIRLALALLLKIDCKEGAKLFLKDP
jgi:hypothetical protein